MDSASYRHIAFLMSISGLPLACAGDDANTATESASTTASTSNGSAGTSTSTGGETATSTGGSTSESSTGGTATGGGSIECEEVASKTSECFPTYSYDSILADCQAQKMKADNPETPGCLAALDAYYACELAATCEELNILSTCAEETDAYVDACTPPPSATCVAYGEKYSECFGDDNGAAGCQLSVDDAVESYGATCGEAYEEYYACLAALDCAAFEDPDACPDEVAAIEAACV